MSDFLTGAKRGSDADYYDFGALPPLAMLLLARVAKEGSQRYGRYNYMRGFPTHDLLNHAQRHIQLHYCGDRSEMHLVKAAWGCLVATQQELLDSSLCKAYMLGPGCTITPEMDELMDLEHSGEESYTEELLPAEIPDVLAVMEERYNEQHEAELVYRCLHDKPTPEEEESDEEEEEKEAPTIAGLLEIDHSDPVLGPPLRVVDLKIPEVHSSHEVCKVFLKDGVRAYYAKPAAEKGYNSTKPSATGRWWEESTSDGTASEGNPLTEPYKSNGPSTF